MDRTELMWFSQGQEEMKRTILGRLSEEKNNIDARSHNLVSGMDMAADIIWHIPIAEVPA